MRAKEFITELNMSPGQLQRFLTSPVAQQMKAGFEAELILPGEYSNDDSVPEPDMSYDEQIRRNTDLDDIYDFFELNHSSHRRSREKIELDYIEYNDEIRSNEINKVIEQLKDENPDLDDDDAYAQAEEAVDDEYETVSFYDYCQHQGWEHYSDIFSYYALDWPHWTTTGEGSFAEAVDEFFNDLSGVVRKNIRILSDYHDEEKNATDWYIEPDSSIDAKQSGYMGVEIVSPPMPVTEMLQKLKDVLAWAQDNRGYTNKSTGLHVGISLGSSTAPVDYIKLALFLGDQYVLQSFNREFNNYTKSVEKIAMQSTAHASDSKLASQLGLLKQGLLKKASESIMSRNDDRYVSINMKNRYIEFRSMGGDYLTDQTNVYNTILRYIRAYAVACDPNAEKELYAKKMYKLLSMSYRSSDNLAPFADYAAGLRSKQDLIAMLAVRRREREAAKAQAAQLAAADDELLNKLHSPAENPNQ